MRVLLALLLLSSAALADYGHAAGTLLPDHAVTPGMARTADVRELCAKWFTTRSVRHTTHEMKCQVYASYGMLGPGCRRPRGSELKSADGSFEVDHLIPLTAGGADDLANLWPQPAEPRPGFHEKDRLEVWMHRQACEMAKTNVTAATAWLVGAQARIADDWTALYEEMNKP